MWGCVRLFVSLHKKWVVFVSVESGWELLLGGAVAFTIRCHCPTSPHIDLRRSASPLLMIEYSVFDASVINQPVCDAPRGVLWERRGLHGLLVFTARSLTQIILLSAHIYMSSLTLNMHRNDVMTYRPAAAKQEDTDLHDLVWTKGAFFDLHCGWWRSLVANHH